MKRSRRIGRERRAFRAMLITLVTLVMLVTGIGFGALIALDALDACSQSADGTFASRGALRVFADPVRHGSAFDVREVPVDRRDDSLRRSGGIVCALRDEAVGGNREAALPAARRLRFRARVSARSA